MTSVDGKTSVFPGPTGTDAGMKACIAMDGCIFLHPLTATFGPTAAIHFLNRIMTRAGECVAAMAIVTLAMCCFVREWRRHGGAAIWATTTHRGEVSAAYTIGWPNGTYQTMSMQGLPFLLQSCMTELLEPTALTARAVACRGNLSFCMNDSTGD
jgi:hypothetical protein